MEKYIFIVIFILIAAIIALSYFGYSTLMGIKRDTEVNKNDLGSLRKDFGYLTRDLESQTLPANLFNVSFPEQNEDYEDEETNEQEEKQENKVEILEEEEEEKDEE